jgi:hypothetical protein
MKRLRAPSTPPPFIDSFILIRDSMQEVANGPRDNLTRRHRAITTRYDAFEQSVAERALDTITPSAYLRAYSEHFEVAYIGNTRALRDLKRQIKILQDPGVLTVCPLCKISLPRTFDHYLPRATFPEFAIHPLNLVPCCETCNGKKLDAWLNEDEQRICLHFYSDTIPQVDFVQCDLNPAAAGSQNVGVTFSLHKPPALGSERWNLIVRHFARLGLIERYNEIGNDELSEIFGNARDFLDNGGPRNRVRAFIRSGGSRFADVHGPSYWRAVLRMKVAQAPALFTWLKR